MPENVFQKILSELKPELPFLLGIADGDGRVVACTEPSRIAGNLPEAVAFFGAQRDAGAFGNYTFRRLNRNVTENYAVFAEQTGDAARLACGITALAIEKSKALFNTPDQRSTFIKKILLENVSPEWIHARAREMRIRSDALRAVFLVRARERWEATGIALLQQMFPNEARDFVVSISDNEVAIVKEIHSSENSEALLLAKQISSTISDSLNLHHTVGVSNIVLHLSDLPRALEEAQCAVSIGRVFGSEPSVIHFEELGIGRLICQLPPELCQRFLSEVFHNGAEDVLDAETLSTVQALFESSLNVSEAARRLFIHRNTLVYRLEKIKKFTGLDLREFDHAVVFQIALMIKRRLETC